MIGGILGVDHVGIGVRDMEPMASFYREVLGFDIVLGTMPEEDHPALHGLLRAPRAVHSSMFLAQTGGSLKVSLFHAVEPVPRPIRSDQRYGDIGVAKITFEVADLDGFLAEKAARLALCSSPKSVTLAGGAGAGVAAPGTAYRFVHAKDPEGNLLEFACPAGEETTPRAWGDTGPRCRSFGLAVTDLDRSLAFYTTAFGFDRLVVPPHSGFSGLVDEISGGSRTLVRSCVVATSRGDGLLELFEVTNPRGRSIPFGTQWGDFGYLQVCLSARAEQGFARTVAAEGLEPLLPLQTVDDPDHPLGFMYVRDPDGIPVEILLGFVS